MEIENETARSDLIKLKRKALSEDFELIKKLSEGIFGDVYLVRDKNTKILKCLKSNKKQKLKDKFCSQFHNEMKILK